MLRIPFHNYPAFTSKLNLDGAVYRFSFIWNHRGEYWTMSIASPDKTPLVDGIKIVLDYELISAFRWMGLPPGELRARDTTGKLERIGRDDLPSGLVQLIYTPEAEVVSAAV